MAGSLRYLRRERILGEGADSHRGVIAEHGVRAGERRPPVTWLGCRDCACSRLDRGPDSRAVQRVERQGRVADVATQARVPNGREARPRAAQSLREVRWRLERGQHPFDGRERVVQAPARPALPRTGRLA